MGGDEYCGAAQPLEDVDIGGDADVELITAEVADDVFSNELEEAGIEDEALSSLPLLDAEAEELVLVITLGC